MITGISTPTVAASSRFSVMAATITRPMPMFLYSSQATTPITPPQITPLISATPTSLRNRCSAWLPESCPMAIARTIMVMVWLPELPPMPATIGISAARATIFEMLPSNAPMTRLARKAVQRFTASHIQRFFTESSTGANRSSSSCKPAMFNISASVSSRITSTISSTVRRPISLPSASVTGAVTKS